MRSKSGIEEKKIECRKLREPKRREGEKEGTAAVPF